MTRMHKLVVMGCLMGGALVSNPMRAQANERHFAYTYESAVLPQGQRELEFWNTWRNGRANFYSRFDHRVEYEVGLTDRLQTSVYVNWHKTSEADPADLTQTKTESEFDGISSEWKYKLLDPVADLVGLAFYQEYTFNSDEFEWESKMILDKKMGSWLAAYNLVVEPEWTFGPGQKEYEINFENDFAVTHFFTPQVSGGLEVRNTQVSTKDSTGFEFSSLFIGPVVSYSSEKWWITASILPQLPALKRSNPDDKWVLNDHEKLNVRVLASIRI